MKRPEFNSVCVGFAFLPLLGAERVEECGTGVGAVEAECRSSGV